MINSQRKQQLLKVMVESGWDGLMLYGHSWRKDYFRSLVNFNFFGPHAIATLTRSGEILILVSHPWDKEILSKNVDANVQYTADFRNGFLEISSKFKIARMAVAGLELMEARFVDGPALSATNLVEAMRKIKS